MLVDGEAVRGCLLLAVQADGARVETVESLAPDPEHLNPLQAEFVRHHGVQCGFCTGGILMSLTAALRDNPRPTEAEIRDTLAGHLCRCTGYQGMVDAVLLRSSPPGTAAPPAASPGDRACSPRRRRPHARRRLHRRADPAPRGRAPAHRARHLRRRPRDARAWRTPPWCGARTPTPACGGIDTAAALALPGVLAVVTAADIADIQKPWPARMPSPVPGTTVRHGVRHTLPVDKVRHVGEVVAAVVAESRALAEDARDLVEVEYDVLPVVATAAAALAPGAPLVYEELGDNIAAHIVQRVGQPERAFAVGRPHAARDLPGDARAAATRWRAAASSRATTRRSTPSPSGTPPRRPTPSAPCSPISSTCPSTACA